MSRLFADGTLSRLFALVAEEHDRPVTQSIATPEPGCPGPHPRLSRNSPRPKMCHHTREPTVLSRAAAQHPNFDRFHLLLGRTSRVGEDCHPRATRRPLTLAESPVSSFLCESLEVFAGRYHGRTLIRPPPSQRVPLRHVGVCTHAGSGPSRVRRRLLMACLGDPIPLSQ